MSIILKGIDPKTDYGLCILTIRGELITANGKHIQAIQIPKNHGNLKDENEIKKNSIDDDYDLYVSWTDIDNAPTILEAEGEE